MPTSRETTENLNYYNGDHWQSWVGPIVPPESDPTGEKMAAIRRVFQSCNLIEECCGNWKDGLISEDFSWYLKGKDGKRIKTSEAQGSVAARAEIELKRWLDWVEQQAIAADPEKTNFKQSDPWSEFVLSLGVIGEGNLRLWQPRKFENDPDPVKRIHLHAPKAGSVEVQRDEDDFIESVTYSYGDSKKEVQTLDEQGQLVVTVTGKGDEVEGEPLTIDTGSRWTVQQVRSPSLLTTPIKQLQNGINHALTMKLRNQELSGFRERVFINCEMPGIYEDDPTTPGGQVFKPNPEGLERGPGYDNFVYGVPNGDSTNPGYATGSIHESEPIEVTSFRESMEIDVALIYRQFKQGHLLANGDGANLSGESRIQQRQAFELALKGWKRRVESAIAAILNIVLKILDYEGLEVVVELRITTGKLSKEEKDEIITEFDKGLLPKSMAMEKLGTVSDVDAAIALLAEEAAEEMKTRPAPNFDGEEQQNQQVKGNSQQPQQEQNEQLV